MRDTEDGSLDEESVADHVSTDGTAILAEAKRRRTFAIISHPDAGKTTLTEKFLLFAGVIQSAGAVRARGGRSATKSDWMALEQERGISVSSTVLQFQVGNNVFNLLDTPGHEDFSEDTYRVLSAVDAAIMVLDSARGIEAQTLKLFEVCRARHTPIITFLNKQDRPGMEPLELSDDISRQLNLKCVPMTWPVGHAGALLGLLDCQTNELIQIDRTAGGAKIPDEKRLNTTEAAQLDPKMWQQACDERDLLIHSDGGWDPKAFAAGELTPIFVGSAIANMGIRELIAAIATIAPPPIPRETAAHEVVKLESDFSGFVFKIQANLDLAHRDRMAFIRVCSGRFERGMSLTHSQTGRAFTTKHAATVQARERETVEEAYPGDIIALVNARQLGIGDTVCVGKAKKYPPLPRFAPENFARVRPLDASKSKQFKAGVEQLDAEGVIQVLRDDIGSPHPIVAVVGALQFDVFKFRMKAEYNTEVELENTPHQVARKTDKASAEELQKLSGIKIVTRTDSTMLALFESPYRLERLLRDSPELVLLPIVE